MSLSIVQKDLITRGVRKILSRKIEKFPQIGQEVRNAPFSQLFLKAFEKQLKNINTPTPYLIAISSWLQGLDTTLGTGFESLAHILSGGIKKQYTRKRGTVLKIKSSQATKIEKIIRDLKSGQLKPNLNEENKAIFAYNVSDNEVNSLDFTVDNYVETDKVIEGIELKSVRPNSGEGKGEKQKILYAKAAFKYNKPTKTIRYYVGFPFDPTSKTSTGYDKERFFDYLVEFKKFFDPNEVLLSSELWDHLSGTRDTMEEILEVINKTLSDIK